MSVRKIFYWLRPTPGLFGVLAILVSVLLYYSYGANKPILLTALDNRITDAMFLWRGTESTTGSVVIVDIDETSLARLGQWPWPRNIVARLVRSIHDSNARVVGIDSVFAEADRSAPKKSLQELLPLLSEDSFSRKLSQLQQDESLDYDLILGRAVAAKPTVLSYIFRFAGPADQARPFPGALIRLSPNVSKFGDLSLIRATGAILNIDAVAMAETEGFINVSPDRTGMVRKVPIIIELDDIPYPSLALEMTRLGLGVDDLTIHVSRQVNRLQQGILGVSLADRFISTDEKAQVTVNYRGPRGTFPYLSAVEVLAGKHQEILRDKYVLIGTSAASLYDLRATPFSSIFPGVEVHATIIDNFLAGDIFRHDKFTEIGLTYALVLGGGLLLTLVMVVAGPLTGALAGFVLMSGTVIGNYFHFFLNQEMVGATYPLLTMVCIFIVVTLANYIAEGRKKSFVQGAFSHYVSPQVVEQLIRSPDKLSLEGELKDLSIFFSDIRGFTSISESMPSDRLANFINEYLTAMSEIIMEFGGTLDKFIGDAIMAIWGAPLDDNDHAFHAVQAAFRMQSRLEELRHKWANQGLPCLTIGIGINSGLVSIGNFGSKFRFDYTVMGDNVNLASRLENASKEYGTGIIISEHTRKALGDRVFCRLLDKVRVRGKEDAVSIYEPLVEGVPDKALAEEVALFEQATHDYRTQRFAEAQRVISKLKEKNPLRVYSLYLYRIEQFLKNQPPSDWDGVERRSKFPENLS